jgi:hypothetical protein
MNQVEEEQNSIEDVKYVVKGRFMGEIRHECGDLNHYPKPGRTRIVATQNRSNVGELRITASHEYVEKEEGEVEGNDSILFRGLSRNGKRMRRGEEEEEKLPESDTKKRRRGGGGGRTTVIDLAKKKILVHARFDCEEVPEFWASVEIPFKDLLAEILDCLDDGEEIEEEEEKKEKEKERKEEEEEEEEDAIPCACCSSYCVCDRIVNCPRCDKRAHIPEFCMECYAREGGGNWEKREAKVEGVVCSILRSDGL